MTCEPKLAEKKILWPYMITGIILLVIFIASTYFNFTRPRIYSLDEYERELIVHADIYDFLYILCFLLTLSFLLVGGVHDKMYLRKEFRTYGDSWRCKQIMLKSYDSVTPTTVEYDGTSNITIMYSHAVTDIVVGDGKVDYEIIARDRKSGSVYDFDFRTIPTIYTINASIEIKPSAPCKVTYKAEDPIRNFNDKEFFEITNLVGRGCDGYVFVIAEDRKTIKIRRNGCI